MSACNESTIHRRKFLGVHQAASRAYNNEHNTMHTHQPTRGQPAPDELRDRLRALVDEVGDLAAAKRLEIPRGTLTRVLAGLPVLDGTIALVRERLGAS